MPEPFNPYHRWLGIPPKHQPADYYRLLGIEQFESDPEVIRDGADRQMVHVRSYQSGEYSALSQKVLNELAAARVCLLNPDRKAVYDEWLREQLAGKAPPVASPPPVARAVPIPPAAIDHPVNTGSIPEIRTDNVLSPPSKRSNRQPAILAVVAAAVALFGALIWSFAGAGGSQPADSRSPRVAQREAEEPDGTPERPTPRLRLNPIAEQRMEAGKTLSLTVLPDDARRWRGRLRFALAPGAPPGAAIDPQTGKFTWSPGPDYEPGTYQVHIVAETPDGQRARTNFAIAVTRPLRLTPIATQRLEAGGTLNLAVLPDDARRWRGRLRFALAPGAPPGAAIDPQTGKFTWTPGPDHEPATYDVIVTARDPEGQRVHTNFAIAVTRPLRLAPIATQRLEAGGTLNLAVLPDDARRWRGRLRFALAPGAPPGAAIDPQTGKFTWRPGPDHEPGTYQVNIVAETPDGQRARTHFAIAVTRRRLVIEASGRREIAIDLGGGIILAMVLLPAGEFMMGSRESHRDAGRDERPRHRVRITRPFYLGKYPVTQEQWKALMGNNPSRFESPKNPVERVSWRQCREFLKRLNDMAADPGREFRLPTEAEWEYACQAGATTLYSFADDADRLGQYAWYRDNSNGQTHPVGQKGPNAWGLYDMHGNVWEWCADWYHDGYYLHSPVDDPPGPGSGALRVYRGGSWSDFSGVCTSAIRGSGAPAHRYDNLGFRAALGHVAVSK